MKRTQAQVAAHEKEDDQSGDKQDEDEKDALEPVKKRKRPDLDSDSFIPAKRTCFPSIKDDKTALTLESFIVQMKKESEQQVEKQNMNNTQKQRRYTKENFAYSLLQGAFETLEREHDGKRLLEVIGWKEEGQAPNIQQLFEFCLKIAT